MKALIDCLASRCPTALNCRSFFHKPQISASPNDWLMFADDMVSHFFWSDLTASSHDAFWFTPFSPRTVVRAFPDRASRTSMPHCLTPDVFVEDVVNSRTRRMCIHMRTALTVVVDRLYVGAKSAIEKKLARSTGRQRPRGWVRNKANSSTQMIQPTCKSSKSWGVCEQLHRPNNCLCCRGLWAHLRNLYCPHLSAGTICVTSQAQT